MPSAKLGFLLTSGSQLVSGNPWSGRPVPTGSIYLKNSITSSGIVYISLSGGMTLTSGGSLSSGGLIDGMELNPGEPYTIPRLGASGVFNLFATTGAATTSGFCRLFWEAF